MSLTPRKGGKNKLKPRIIVLCGGEKTEYHYFKNLYDYFKTHKNPDYTLSIEKTNRADPNNLFKKSLSADRTIRKAKYFRRKISIGAFLIVMTFKTQH